MFCEKNMHVEAYKQLNFLKQKIQRTFLLKICIM